MLIFEFSLFRDLFVEILDINVSRRIAKISKRVLRRLTELKKKSIHHFRYTAAAFLRLSSYSDSGDVM